MLNGEFALSNKHKSPVVESRQSVVGDSDPDENVNDREQKHDQWCILTCGDRVPENQEAVPGDGEQGDEDKRRRKPSI